MSKMNKVLLRSVTAVALSVAMALSMSGGVFATPSAAKNGTFVVISEEDNQNHGGATTTTSADISQSNSSVLAVVNNPTTYTVSVPKMIELGTTSAAGSKTFTYSVACDLEPTQTLTLSATDITLKHKAGTANALTHTVTSSLATTSIAAGTYQTATDYTGTLSWTNPIRAGYWVGSMQITAVVSAATDTGIAQ